MKNKLKGHSGVKRLLLIHGEKLIMAVFVLAAAYLVYTSLRVEGLSDQYEPAILVANVGQTTNTIASNTWDRTIREHPDLVKLSSDSVKSDAFHADPTSFKSPILDPRVLDRIQPRVDPAYVAAVEVRATSGADLFAFNDPVKRAEYDRRQQEAELKREKQRQRDQEKEQKENERTTNRARRPGGEDVRAGFDPDHPNRWNVTRRVGGAELAGGETVEFNRWVSITAKVPIKKQIQQYRQAFENASGGFNPEADVPLYIGALVQRAEYIPGAAPDALTWTPVPLTNARGPASRQVLGTVMSSPTLETLANNHMDKWIGGASAEVVHPHYLSPSGCLVYPLAPIVGRDWGREATHPDIPLATDPVKETSSNLAQTVPSSTPTTGSDDQFRTPSGITPPPQATPGYTGGGGTPAGGANVRTRRQPAAPSPVAEAPAPATATRTRRSPTGGGSGAGLPTAAASRSTQMASVGPPPADLEYYLFRFFDFTAEPGKLYVYRVQLALADPNLRYLSTPSALDSKVLARLKTASVDANGNRRETVPVFTAWSDPSPPVGIPLEGRVRLAGSSGSDDPRVDLVVDGFAPGPETGNWVQASKLKEGLTRGSVVNFTENTDYLLENRLFVDRFDGTFSFTTGVTVLDARGGERVGRNDTAPSRVLVMGPGGDLKIRREIDDAPDVQNFRDVFTKPKPVPVR
jgi:hypothetical protein